MTLAVCKGANALTALAPAAVPTATPTFRRVGSLPLGPGENIAFSFVIDTTNGFAYYGTSTSPGIIGKVRLSDFTRVGSLTLNSGENYLLSAVIDTANGFSYFGADSNSGTIVKVRLSDFTRVGALSLNAPLPFPALVDTANGFAYFGSTTIDDAIVMIVRLSV